jgi:hypothetical protein
MRSRETTTGGGQRAASVALSLENPPASCLNGAAGGMSSVLAVDDFPSIQRSRSPSEVATNSPAAIGCGLPNGTQQQQQQQQILLGNVGEKFEGKGQQASAAAVPLKV